MAVDADRIRDDRIRIVESDQAFERDLGRQAYRRRFGRIASGHIVRGGIAPRFDDQLASHPRHRRRKHDMTVPDIEVRPVSLTPVVGGYRIGNFNAWDNDRNIVTHLDDDVARALRYQPATASI